MQNAGYHTSYIGKWHVNQAHTPLEYGFDYYYSDAEHNEWMHSQGYDHGIKALLKEKGYIAMLGQESPVPYEAAAPHHFAKKTIEQIDKSLKGEEPFCIVMSTLEPHLPCCPSKPFSDMFSPQDVEKWGGFDDDFENKPYIQKQMVRNWTLENLTWEDWSACVARYYACIAQVDDAIGRVIRHVEELGLASDTVIIYSADHGDMCGSHRDAG